MKMLLIITKSKIKRFTARLEKKKTFKLGGLFGKETQAKVGGTGRKNSWIFDPLLLQRFKIFLGQIFCRRLPNDSAHDSAKDSKEDSKHDSELILPRIPKKTPNMILLMILPRTPKKTPNMTLHMTLPKTPTTIPNMTLPEILTMILQKTPILTPKKIQSMTLPETRIMILNIPIL